MDPRFDDAKYPVVTVGNSASRSLLPSGAINWEYVWAVDAWMKANPTPPPAPIDKSALLPWQLQNLVNGNDPDDNPPPGWSKTAHGSWICDPTSVPVLVHNVETALAALKAKVLS